MSILDEVLGFTDTITNSRVVSGVVTSESANGATVELLDGSKALLPRGEAPLGKIPKQGWRGQMLELDNSGETKILSMTHPELVAALLAGVVPELRSGDVRVMKVAQLPGIRAKVAVATTRDDLDPVATFVGRGANRVKHLSQVLNGERVDIIPWNSDREVLLRNAFAPATVSEVVSEGHTAAVSVPAHLMSAAVGRGGLNASLAGRLAGFKVVVVREGASLQEALDQLKVEVEAA